MYQKPVTDYPFPGNGSHLTDSHPSDDNRRGDVRRRAPHPVPQLEGILRPGGRGRPKV